MVQMSYDYDPRGRNKKLARKGRVPPQLRAWVFGRRTKSGKQYDPSPRRRSRKSERRYDPISYAGVRKRLSPLQRAITPITAFVTGIQQMIGKDVEYAGATFDGYDLTTKLKFVVNRIAGRTIGFNPFPETGKQGQVINPLGMLNKWTGIGIGLLLARKVPGLPYKGMMGRLGKGALAGGLLGGFFDQPKASAEKGASQYSQMMRGQSNPGMWVNPMEGKYS